MKKGKILGRITGGLLLGKSATMMIMDDIAEKELGRPLLRMTPPPTTTETNMPQPVVDHRNRKQRRRHAALKGRSK